ncbi:MAG TPA: hypothetical protein VFE47_09270 [Tepidisphaeraceae bacterium]|nr:hypothetical protein [Tepidisphaeraceae bacterium]
MGCQRGIAAVERIVDNAADSGHDACGNSLMHSAPGMDGFYMTLRESCRVRIADHYV